jgi:hypothetical protein
LGYGLPGDVPNQRFAPFSASRITLFFFRKKENRSGKEKNDYLKSRKV